MASLAITLLAAACGGAGALHAAAPSTTAAPGVSVTAACTAGDEFAIDMRNFLEGTGSVNTNAMTAEENRAAAYGPPLVGDVQAILTAGTAVGHNPSNANLTAFSQADAKIVTDCANLAPG